MKRLSFSVLVALILVTVMTMPVAAVEEQQVGASVDVNAVVSITLTDAGDSGLDFGAVEPGIEDVKEEAQSDGTPAIQVVVESETNIDVDIGIKGAITGSLALAEWEYSTAWGDPPTTTSLTVSYVKVYTDVGVGSNAFYHWVDVPAGTAAGSQGCTVYYKAVETGGTL
jgi:hypothetical protein